MVFSSSSKGLRSQFSLTPFCLSELLQAIPQHKNLSKCFRQPCRMTLTWQLNTQKLRMHSKWVAKSHGSGGSGWTRLFSTEWEPGGCMKAVTKVWRENKTSHKKRISIVSFLLDSNQMKTFGYTPKKQGLQRRSLEENSLHLTTLLSNYIEIRCVAFSGEFHSYIGGTGKKCGLKTCVCLLYFCYINVFPSFSVWFARPGRKSHKSRLCSLKEDCLIIVISCSSYDGDEHFSSKCMNVYEAFVFG